MRPRGGEIVKISVKDMWAGGLLVFVALLGLFINGGLFGIGLEQHALGTARRMGPGYMPMLVFWLLLGLGTLVVVTALRGGPDPLEKWDRIDGVTLAAAVGVGLVLWQLMERTGVTSNWVQVSVPLTAGLFILAISPAWRALAMALASFVVFGLFLEFLCVLAWFVFIYELDVRIPVWPTIF
jgi:hypothetical protein